MKIMKKYELKNGMLVEFRNGEINPILIDASTVCHDHISFISRYNVVNCDVDVSLDMYDDDLFNHDDDNLDIVRVYVAKWSLEIIEILSVLHSGNEEARKNILEKTDVVWERIEEREEMTLSQIEEILGKKIKIIPETNEEKYGKLFTTRNTRDWNPCHSIDEED